MKAAVEPWDSVALARALGRGRDVVSVAAVPSPYASSHPLMEIEVAYGDGGRVELVVKDLSAGALTPEARRAKTSSLYDPLREIEVYRDVLPRARLGTASVHAIVLDGSRRLLAIERINGRVLTEVGEIETWCGVASWLADAHRRLGPLRSPRLVRWDAALVAMWWERAARLRPDRTVARVADRRIEVAQRLLSTPVGLIHGELFASNVIVASDGRVCPVDWELAGVGPQLLDLAALVAGRWSEGDREAIAREYRAAMPEAPAEEEFFEQLDLCRLQLAGQLLAGSRSWTPPAEHAHDWLSDVRTIAPRLGLA